MISFLQDLINHLFAYTDLKRELFLQQWYAFVWKMKSGLFMTWQVGYDMISQDTKSIDFIKTIPDLFLDYSKFVRRLFEDRSKVIRLNSNKVLITFLWPYNNFPIIKDGRLNKDSFG